MKRILISLSTLTFVAALTAGATGAFFSDAQTSSSNIFTAGSIHLQIDHSLSTYNGNPVAQDLVIVTDPTWTFVGDGGTTPASGTAADLTFVHPAWETISGANWIWATDPVSDPAGATDQTYTFTKTFTWSGPVTSASLQFGADNYYDVSVNGHSVGSNHSLITGNFQDPHTTDVTADIVQGTNTITFIGENQHVDGSDFHGNPAGIILRLEVQGQQLTPDPIDLTGEPFWTFDDVKPMDRGYDVFSLHEATNDAWACIIVNGIQNDENSLTQPETDAGDVTAGDINGKGKGELGEFLHLFMWRDLNGNGVYEPGSGETALTPLTGVPFTGSSFIVPVNDSTLAGGPLLGNTTEDVGSAWCMGNMSVNPGTGVITCADAGPTENQAQTDSTTANLTFYATQARNQPTFQCSSVNLSQ